MKITARSDAGTFNEIVTARCPVCSIPVPIFFLSVTTSGRWKHNLNVTIDGDATDWVAHIWQHQESDRERSR